MKRHFNGIVLFTLGLVCFNLFVFGETSHAKPQLRNEDRIRIAEAFRMADSCGNLLWRDWNRVPFAVLLVAPEFEFLIRHPQPAAEFEALGYDDLLKSYVFCRKKTFDIHFLATFPVDGISTIVVGQPENTGQSSTGWIATLLHEHLHQLQYAQDDYLSNVQSLDLSGGDKTGMWMLNYPFPYDSLPVRRAYDTLARAIYNVLKTDDSAEFKVHYKEYIAARTDLRNSLNAKDYKYISFQLWQEGIARYTELRMAEIAAQKFHPADALRKIRDFKSFSETAAEIKRKILNELSHASLHENKRNSFYALGTGEGMILDRVNPGWRERYLQDGFYLEKYLNDH